MPWNRSAAVAADEAAPGLGCRLVPLDQQDAPESRTFAELVTRNDFHSSVVVRAKQALLDDLRTLVLEGVEPRADGLERAPTADSLTLAERLLRWLPDDIDLPTVCLPDDGEITFTWQPAKSDGGDWRATLAIAPDLEVECFVRRRSDQAAAAHFNADDCSEINELPVEIEDALRAHWQSTHAA